MKKLSVVLLVVLLGATVDAQTVQKGVIETYIHNSNVFVKFNDGSVKQLTFTNSDASPIILKKENAIVFIRNSAGDAKQPKVKKIMKVSCSSLIEKTITDKKPFQDGLDNTNYILGINSPTLSQEQDYLYFTTEKFATSAELVKINLTTGKWTELFPANHFELIKHGQYKGLFLVARSEIKGAGGRSDYYYLVNEKNQTLKEFDTEGYYLQFKKSIGLK
jgi:hypothetical protein